MKFTAIPRIASAGILVVGLVAAGCSSETPAAPGAEVPSFGFFPVGTAPSLAANNNVPIEAFKVCKEYSGTVGPAVSILVEIDAGNDGSVQHSIPLTVANGECWMLWEASGGVTDLVTVTETVPNGYTASYVMQTVLDQTLPAQPAGAPVNSNTASSTIINRGAGLVTGVKVTFTNTEVTSTGCTLTQGYWKNHAGYKKQDDAWPVQELTIGGIVYTKAELVAIMQAPTAGNGIMSLMQQLIAAMLNVANGASNTAIAQAIIDANTMIDDAGGKIVPPYTSPSLATSVTSALNTALTNYNEGLTGPGHCGD